MTPSDTAPNDFTAVLHLPADPATISALFTSADGVSRWWGPTDGDATPGGTIVTSFGDFGANAMRVVQADPSRIVWEPTTVPGTTPTGHTREWLGTRVEIDVLPDGDGSELRFRHVGLSPKLECWDNSVAGWTMFLDSIQTFAKTGTGTPFRP